MIDLKRHPDDGRYIQLFRGFENRIQSLYGAVEKSLLVKQVLTRICRQAQFREKGEHRAFPLGRLDQFDGFRAVESGISDAALGNANRNPDKPVVVKVKKIPVVAHRFDYRLWRISPRRANAPSRQGWWKKEA
jgi:hypothetical protein